MAKPNAGKDVEADADLAEHPLIAFVDAVVILLTSGRYPVAPKNLDDLRAAADALKASVAPGA